jgi:protein-disulfide isomerase
MKRWLAVLALVGSAWGVMAQPLPATEEAREVEVGAAVLTLPANWEALAGRNQAVLLTNSTFEALQARSFAEGTVLFQANLIPPSLLTQAGVSTTISAGELLALTAGDTPLEISEATIEERAFATAILEEEGIRQELYALALGEGAYAVMSVVELSAGALDAQRDSINLALGTLRINYAGDIPEDAIDYSALPRGYSADGFPMIGREDARVKLVEISSFSCPFCATFHAEVLPGIVELVAAGDVSFTYVPFYRAGSVGDGRAASLAAMCADVQGAFWEYHDLLFAWQRFGSFAYERPRLLDGAEKLGLDMENFTQCLDEEFSLSALNAAEAFAQRQRGFQGTPTLLLNGTLITALPFEAVELAIRTVLDAPAPEVTPEATPEAGS